jgi:hypothetical protein
MSGPKPAPLGRAFFPLITRGWGVQKFARYETRLPLLCFWMEEPA